MNRYNASVVYNASTLRRLGWIQNRSRVLHNVVYVAMCLVLILAGVFFGLQTVPGLLCIAAGSMGLPLLNAVGRTATDQLIKALGENEIRVEYRFYEKDFTQSTQGKTTRKAYKDLVRLWEDDDYFYVFPSGNQAFMIEKAGMTPSAELFREQMEKETGLSWNQSSRLLFMNIKSIALELKQVWNTRRKRRQR